MTNGHWLDCEQVPDVDYITEDIPDMASSDGVSVHAGFPNAADDRRGQGAALDLNQLLIRHPISTFYFRITGHGSEEQGIYEGDLAIIDRSVAPRSTDLVMTWQEDSFAIKRFKHSAQIEPWGVVISVIHRYNQS
jgi:DNA polymerase V